MSMFNLLRYIMYNIYTKYDDDHGDDDDDDDDNDGDAHRIKILPDNACLKKCFKKMQPYFLKALLVLM